MRMYEHWKKKTVKDQAIQLLTIIASMQQYIGSTSNARRNYLDISSFGGVVFSWKIYFYWNTVIDK